MQTARPTVGQNRQFHHASGKLSPTIVPVSRGRFGTLPLHRRRFSIGGEQSLTRDGECRR
ncbi:MAG: hypothetical protein KME26_31740 [Oscillatoria princeps RMCB-10]|nr:hypothetical protein [Oscillatoria princeps RMCB-10]